MAGRRNDVTQWHLFATRCLNTQRKVHAKAVEIVNESATELMNDIKGQMPVKTGRAKAGWGKYTSSDLVMANPESNSGDAVWEVSEKGLSIQQGTNVPYTETLNVRGSTRCNVPPAFIDALAAFAVEGMNQRLAVINTLIASELG